MAGLTPTSGGGSSEYIKRNEGTPVRREEQQHVVADGTGPSRETGSPAYSRHLAGSGGVEHTKAIVVDGEHVLFPESMTLVGPGSNYTVETVAGAQPVVTPGGGEFSKASGPCVGDYDKV